MSGECDLCFSTEDVFQVSINSSPPDDGKEHDVVINQSFELCTQCRLTMNNLNLALMVISCPPGTFIPKDNNNHFPDIVNPN